MVKPLAFKGERKSKKRKTAHAHNILNIEEGGREDLTPKSTINEAEEEQDDSWVTAEIPTDISGPIVFALPSASPTCLACDANGKVFTSEIVNIIEGNLATTEPHDVRQVWIASRIAGTDEISFRGHHGRYAHAHTLRV